MTIISTTSASTIALRIWPSLFELLLMLPQLVRFVAASRQEVGLACWPKMARSPI